MESTNSFRGEWKGIEDHLCKKHYFLNLLLYWHLFEIPHTSPTTKSSKNMVKDKFCCKIFTIGGANVFGNE